MDDRSGKTPPDGDIPTPFRVLAGFGAIADEAATIDTAMALAQALEAEIAGCFVEDIDLLNLAALPFARAVRPADRSVEEIEHEQMQRQISRAASNWETMLEARARGARVRCSFKTMRGGYSAEIARETATTDIVVMNPANLPQHRQDAVSLLLHGLREAAGTVILPERHHKRAGGPIVLVATEPDGERSVFELAERIARTMGSRTIVLLGGDDPAGPSKARAVAQEVFGARADFRNLPGDHMSAIAATLADLHPSFVVLQPSAGSLTDAMIELLLNAGRAPLMLIRRAG